MTYRDRHVVITGGTGALGGGRGVAARRRRLSCAFP
jgi:hypothetical protein